MFINIIDVLPRYFHEPCIYNFFQEIWCISFFYMVEEVLEYVEKKIRYVE